MLHLLLGAALAAATPSPGDIAYKTGRFDEALAAYSAAAVADPADADALLGRGTIELYRNQLTEAKRDLGAVVAGDPQNMRAKTRLAQAVQREGSPGVFTIDMHGSGEVDVPLLGIDPLPTLRVTVNGHPLTLFIDTGATTIDLSPEATKAVGAQTVSAGQGVFAGGQTGSISRTTFDTVDVAGITIHAMPGDVIDGLAPLAGQHIDGAIGTLFLDRFLSTIDYRRKLLILRPPGASAAFEADAARRGLDTRTMWLVGDHFIFARAQVNDRADDLFNIDTGGSGVGVQLTKAALDAAGIVPDAGKAQSFQGGDGQTQVLPFHAKVTFGTLSERDVPGLYFTAGDQYGIFPFTVAGTLSHEFFRTHALSFDFVAMRIVVE